jgi:hypothetical protein
MDKRSTYIRGVGVGLIISWVTSGIAYLKGGQSTILFDLILFQLILSVIFILVAYLINTERGKSRKS